MLPLFVEDVNISVDARLGITEISGLDVIWSYTIGIILNRTRHTVLLILDLSLVCSIAISLRSLPPFVFFTFFIPFIATIKFHMGAHSIDKETNYFYIIL